MVMSYHTVNVLAEHRTARKKRAQSPQRTPARNDGPSKRKAVDEARYRGRGRVPHNGREGGQEDEEEDDEPSAREGAPVLGHGAQPGEEGVRVDEEQDAQHANDQRRQHGEEPLQRRHAQVHLEDLLAQQRHRREHPARERLVLPRAHERVGEAPARRCGAGPWRERRRRRFPARGRDGEGLGRGLVVGRHDGTTIRRFQRYGGKGERCCVVLRYRVRFGCSGATRPCCS